MPSLNQIKLPGVMGAMLSMALQKKVPTAMGGTVPALGKTDADGRVSADTYYGTGQGSTLSKEARDAMNPANKPQLNRTGGNLGLSSSIINKKQQLNSMSLASSATGALRGLSGGLI